jgi:hypothetical protein
VLLSKQLTFFFAVSALFFVDQQLPSCTECRLRNVDCSYNEPKKRGPRSGAMKAARQSGGASDDEDSDDAERPSEGEKKRAS